MKMKSIKLILSLVIFVAVSANRTGVFKCCPDGFITVARNYSCWEPYSNTTLPILFPCKRIVPYRSNYSINEAGDVSYKNAAGKTFTIPFDKYCLGNNTRVTAIINWSKVREVPMLCADRKETIVDDTLYSYCFIFSSVFLAITAIIYAALPELRRDVQGLSLINFCGSQAVALAMLAVLNLVSYSDMSLCAARGFIGYFFVIVSFFWTNAIAIQVLRSVSCPTIGSGQREFLWYALYAWGCGALLTACMAIVNFHPGDHDKPGIGLEHCWFYDLRQQWYYMFSVMTLLLAANTCIFIYTSTLIWRHSFSSSNIKALKYKLVMSLRLMIIMGLPWIFEMISSVLDDHIVWVIMNFFNTLQGVLIFLVLVVFRKRALRAMAARGWLLCAAGPVERFLAQGFDDEDLAVHHTQVPMHDYNGTNGIN